MNDLNQSSHWLVRASQAVRPGFNVPTAVEIPDDKSEAWRQVARIFHLTPGELADAVASAFGLKQGRLDTFQPGDASLLPERLCRELGIVQFRVEEKSVCFALSDEQRSRLRFTVGRPIDWVVASPDDIDTCLTRCFAESGASRSMKTHVIDLLSTDLPGDSAPLVKLACAVLRQAIDSDASDVHIHPFAGGGIIRFRIDGRLKRIASLPIESLDGLSRYLKAQAGLEPNPLKPQDGRLRLAYGRRENSVDVNIMTLEDPVEYVLPGVSQVQVNEKQGLSFADTLRSVLRQDPDIVLVGEMRDGETARIATQAALTGHLVLSTLHTNSALGALPRLLDLGLDASILADALIGMVSQRLVRKLCEPCRQPTSAPYLASESEFQRIVGEYPAYRPSGCQACHSTGFRGRLPIIESLEISLPLRQAIVDGERRLDELSRVAGGYRGSVPSRIGWNGKCRRGTQYSMAEPASSW